MTKKHFIGLADAIRQHNAYGEDKFTDAHLRALAEFCRSQNTRFMGGRWLDYIAGKCGKNGGAIKS